MNPTRYPARIAASLAAVATTTLLLASQFGLASHYTGRADAAMAWQRAPAVVVQAAAPAASRPRS